MKKQQYYSHTERAYIYYLDWQGEERRLFVWEFPIHRKDVYSTAVEFLKELATYKFGVTPIRVEWHVWAGRRKGSGKRVIDFTRRSNIFIKKCKH